MNPQYKFTLEYPATNPGETGEPVIIYDEDDNRYTLVSEKGFLLYIQSANGTDNIKPFVETQMKKDLSQENYTLIQDIKPVNYANMSGYEFATFNGLESVNTNVFLKHGNDIFKFLTITKMNDYNMSNFHRIVDSVKFLS